MRRETKQKLADHCSKEFDATLVILSLWLKEANGLGCDLDEKQKEIEDDLFLTHRQVA